MDLDRGAVDAAGLGGVMADETKAFMEIATRLIDACASLPMDDRLFVLQVAWIILAQQARNEALAIPGGFPAEQARQLLTLGNVARLVEGDTPDLELERLWLEGDVEGAIQHVLKLRDTLEKGGE